MAEEKKTDLEDLVCGEKKEVPILWGVTDEHLRHELCCALSETVTDVLKDYDIGKFNVLSGCPDYNAVFYSKNNPQQELIVKFSVKTRIKEGR